MVRDFAKLNFLYVRLIVDYILVLQKGQSCIFSIKNMFFFVSDAFLLPTFNF